MCFELGVAGDAHLDPIQGLGVASLRSMEDGLAASPKEQS